MQTTVTATWIIRCNMQTTVTATWIIRCNMQTTVTATWNIRFNMKISLYCPHNLLMFFWFCSCLQPSLPPIFLRITNKLYAVFGRSKPQRSVRCMLHVFHFMTNWQSYIMEQELNFISVYTTMPVDCRSTCLRVVRYYLPVSLGHHVYNL